MASIVEQLDIGEFLEDGTRLKRTARKSTYVPKNALSHIKSPPATSVRTPTNGSLLKSKNVLKKIVLPPKVINELSSAVEVTPIYAEKILKIQKAKKGFISNFNKNNVSPNSLNGGPITRSRPSLAPPTLATNKKLPTTSNSPTAENSNQKMKLRTRDTKIDAHDIVDKKTPVVALDNIVRISTTPKVDLVPINLKKSSRSSAGLFINNVKKSAKIDAGDKEVNNSSNSSPVLLRRSSSQVSLLNNNNSKKNAATAASEKCNSSDSSSTTAQVILISNDNKKLTLAVASEKEINNSKKSAFPLPQVSLISSKCKVLTKAESINSRQSSLPSQVSLISNNYKTAASKPVAEEKECNDCGDKVVADVGTRVQRKRKSEKLENKTSAKIRVIDASNLNEKTKLSCDEIEVDKQDNTTSASLLINVGCDISDDAKSVEKEICVDIVNNKNVKNNYDSNDTTNLRTVTEDQSKIEKKIEVKTLDGTSLSIKKEKTDFSGILPALKTLARNVVSETKDKIGTEKKQSPLTTEEQNEDKSLPWAAQALKPSTSSKSSLLQHLPNIDVIDDVEFLSFETEDDLHRFVKRHPTYTLDLRRRNGVLRTKGDPIKLTKTSDITKIKGWRNKVFESGDNRLNKSRNRFGYPSFQTLSQKSCLAEQRAKEDENSEYYKDKENTLEHLDLDIDVYEERSQDGFHGAQDDDYEYSKVLQSDDLSQTGRIKDEPLNRENGSKSAFISDYLDDFLRNKSALRTSLDTKNKTEASPSKRIITKVVWPTQAGSPSRELSKIKPPPFQISLPVKKAIETNTTKSNKVGSFSQSSNADSKESPPKLSSFLNSQSNKNSAIKLKCGEWSPNITLKQAIEAVGALVYPIHLQARPENKRKSHSPKLTIAEEQVNTTPRTSSEKQETLIVNNLSVNISRQAAEFAVKALVLIKDGKVKNLEKPPQVMSISLKPKVNAVPSKFTQKKSPEVSESSPKLKVAQLEEEANPPSPYSAELEASVNERETVSVCWKPYCKLGCVCDSLKVPKRKRGHCGKSPCMFICTCKTIKTKVEEDLSARHKRQIRLPARLKDSFLWNGGRDLPINFDWDMSVHRKGEVRDEQTKVLWKDSAKWHLPVIRPKEARKRVVHRAKSPAVKHLPGDLTKKFKSLPKMPMVDLGIKSPPRQSLPKFKEATQSPSSSSSVEASRANLQKALSKQLLGYKPCVVNVKKVFNEKGGGAWKIVNKFEEKDAAYLRKVDEKRSAEPNQMLPHDWRFVSKPPELDPNCNDGKRQNWNNLKIKRNILPASAKRQDMRLQLKRLNYLIKPMMKELKQDNPGLKNTKTLLVELAKQSIKRLRQKEMDLLHEKFDVTIKRNALFERFKLQLKGMSVDKQKSITKDLAKLLHSCCKGVVRNRMNPGGDATRSYKNADKETDMKEMVSDGEFEDYLSDVNTSDEDSSSEDSSDDDSDGPRVVIENDLEDECEPNNTIIDISSNNMGSVSNATYFQRAPMSSSNNTVLQPAPQTMTKISNIYPSGKKWMKLTPCSKTSFNRFNCKISKEIFGTGSKTNVGKGAVEQVPVAKETSATGIDVGKGFVDVVSSPKNPREYLSFKIPSSLFSNKRTINGDVNDKLSTGTSSNLNLEESSKTNSVPLKDGIDQTVTKFPINSENTLPGTTISPLDANSMQQKYATILIPISYLGGTISQNSTMNLEKVKVSKAGGGIIFKPFATTAVANFPGNVTSCLNSDQSKSVQCSDDFKRPPKPAQRSKFSNVVKKVLEFTSVPNQVQEQEIVSTKLESLSESKADSNHCSQISKVAGEGSLSTNPAADVNSNAAQTDNGLEDQCDNEEDAEVANEEMFKIVGFSSISEDEFRLKED